MNSLTPPCDNDHHGQPDSQVLSLRIEAALLERLTDHAAKRGMSVQDYVVRTLVRDDFDERFKASVEETERFYGRSA
ncbi:hypothetical protein [Streptomyces reniochalinae]|uniref:Ribbon-helix-helix protein, CopG family n=1 Tax=Streptomyces reniochalinae TaxID=2250578 RepID=A0A367ELC1_9ACTN|nr:hypothetical protein [Streptomyces reniochalinae]RCG18010.1 hypothetical protein DQ392_15135 [Streptomyces reniochalinae]